MTVPSKRHIPALDGVRGFAVLMVVAFHAGGGTTSSHAIVRAAGKLAKHGWMGVTLFFVLSGFLITGIILDSAGAPHFFRNFYARRSLRIFPLYYLALLLVILAAVPPGDLLGCLRKAWIYFFYLQNVPPFSAMANVVPSSMAVYHLWSLAVEEQFYLIWPFLLALTRTLRQASLACVAVVAGSLCYRCLEAYVFHAGPGLQDSLPANAGSLALGALLAIAYRSDLRRRVQVLAPYAAALTFGLYLLLEHFAPATETWQRVHIAGDLLLISLFFTSLVSLVLKGGWLQRAFSVAWLRWIGTVSYGIYVYHVLLSVYFGRLTTFLFPAASPMAFSGWRLLITVILTLLISWLSFTFFESRFTQLKSKFTR